MPDSALQVKITADVTDLQTKMAIAQAVDKQMLASVRDLAKGVVAASEEMKSAQQAQLQQAVEAAAAQTATVNALKTAIAAANAEIARSNMEAAEASRGGFAKLVEGVEGTTKSVQGLTDKFTSFGRLAGSLSEFVVAGLAVDQVGEAINHVAETGAGLLKLSQETGLTTEQLSGLRVGAQLTGTDFDEVTRILQRMPNTLQEAASGTGKAADAFRAMGIQVTDASGNIRPMADIIDELFAKLLTYSDGANKAALETDVFGSKLGATMIPLGNLIGKEGIGGLIIQSDNLHSTWTGETAEAAEQYEQDMARASAATHGLEDMIVRGLLPALTALAENLAPDINGQIAQVEHEINTLSARQVYLKPKLELDLSGLEAQKKQLDASIAAQSAGAGGAAAGTAQAPSITGGGSLGDHQGVAGQDNSNAGGNTYDYSAGGAGDGGASKAQAAQDQITQIAQAAADARKQISASEYETQISTWDAQVTAGQMTKAQEVQAEISAQNQMYQAQLTEAEKEAALLQAGTVAKAKALDDIQVMTAQHVETISQMNAALVQAQVQQANELQQKQQAAAQATQQAWQRAFQPITSAFDTSIKGIIQGTETLKQAEAKAAQSVVLSFVDAAAKKLEAYVASEAEMLATKAGFTASGKAIDAAAGSETIIHNAYVAASGAFAAVASIPYIGPVLAPAAAAAAFAGVMAFDVLSAEGGMTIGAGVNPVVQLHEKEMVLPAHIAQPLQTMISNGGSINDSSGDTNVTNHFNLTAHGGGGGADAETILSTLNTAVRSGSLQKYPAIARMMRR
jgi:hypothetical protein